MVKVFLREFKIPELPAGNQHIVTDAAGNKLSESVYKQFVPILEISVLNSSSYDIKVFVNEAVDSAIRLPPNSSRPISGFPMHDISVQNLGAGTIGANEVIITCLNDFEQIARYEAYLKRL